MDKETMKNDLFMPTKGTVLYLLDQQTDRLHFYTQGAELLGRRFYQKKTEEGGIIK